MRPNDCSVLHILSTFMRPLRFVMPLQGRKHVFSSPKAQQLLEWKPRAAATMVVDAAKSAMALGVV